jgi:hypothetical protein
VFYFYKQEGRYYGNINKPGTTQEPNQDRFSGSPLGAA